MPDRMTSAVRVERSDVRRNRAALLTAGRELLTRDPDAPLYEVAKLAGVGQATLYRHFPDRSVFAAALADQIFDEIEAGVAQLDESKPSALFDVVESICKSSIGAGTLYPLLSATPDDHTDISHLQDRMRQLILVPLRDAKKSGLVRSDISAADILFVVRMVTSTVRATLEEPLERTRPAACERALRFAWAGVVPPETLKSRASKR